MKRSITGAGHALSLALALLACDRSPEQHLLQAQERLAKHEYPAAVVELKSALQQQPENGDARLLLGQAFVAIAAYPDAVTELLKARELGVANDQVLAALLEAYVKMGQPQKALDLGFASTAAAPAIQAIVLTRRAEAQIALRQKDQAKESIAAARRADPEQPATLLVEAVLALIDQEKERAGQLVAAALQRDAKFADALYFQAGLLQAENKVEEAVQVYRQILADDPAQFRAHLAIADLHQRRGDMAAAEAAISAAEKVSGSAPTVRFARGNLELRRGNLPAANTALLEVLRVAPDHVPTLLAAALVGFGLGDYQQSISRANKVLAVQADNLLAAKILADSQLHSGDVKGALRTLQPLLTRYPNDPRLLALAGDTHLRAGDFAKAIAALDKAAELEPDNPGIKNSLATGHLAAGDSQQALTSLEQAVRLEGKPGQADLRLILLRLQRKEYDQALADIANLEKKLPGNPLTQTLRADALLAKQDRAGARKALEEALAAQPGFFAAAMRLAKLDLQEKDLPAARKRFESILTVDKNNAAAMLALAELAGLEKRPEDYGVWLEKVIEADPQAIRVRAALVAHYLAQKEKQKALELATEGAQSKPGDLAAINLLAETQKAVGDRTAAIDTWRGMTRAAPQAPEAHLKLAQAQIGERQWAAARATLQTALRLKADFLAAQDALLRVEVQEKKFDAALRIARQIQLQRPTAAVGFDREGEILQAQQRYPQAVKLYEQALDKGAGTTGLIKLHRALLAAGDNRGAEKRLSEWLAQRPADLVARAYAGEAYTASGNTRAAIAQYAELLQANPDNVVALNNLASLYQRERDPRAVATAERALVLAPEHPGVQDTLGWILVEQAQLPRGLSLLGKAASGTPNAPTVRYHHGAALAKAGKRAEAKSELAAALALGQPFPEQHQAKALLKELE